MSWSNQKNHATRFFHAPDEQGNIMKPIQGYQNMPLVSLAEAIKPLISTVNDIEQMVWTVKPNCKNPSDNLSSDESASIMLYTLEWKSRESSFYFILNKTLRAEDRLALRPWFLYLKLFITTLSKLPSESRYLHRGVKGNIVADYPVDKTFVWWAFTSCTLSLNTLEDDEFLGKTGSRTLFTIDCRSGKDIRAHSMVKMEDEVLLLAARQFKVISTLNAGNDLNIIHIAEIEPPHALLEPVSSSNTYTPIMKATNLSHNHHNEKLEELIRQCQSQNLNLSGEQLLDQDMNIVVTKGIISKRCTVLNLMYNRITISGVLILADALRNNKTLEELILSHNTISNAGVRSLAVAVNTSIIKRIDLTENDISDDGAKYLAEMLVTNINLLELKLDHNQIGNDGAGMLYKVLTNDNTHLESLNINANRKINDESIDKLIDMMEHNRSLKKLDLRHSGLSKDGEIRLQKVAKSKKGFQIWLSYVM